MLLTVMLEATRRTKDMNTPRGLSIEEAKQLREKSNILINHCLKFGPVFSPLKTKFFRTIYPFHPYL